MSAEEERRAEQREAVGLPVLRCPNCGAAAAHYIPAGLEEPAHYICVEGDQR